MKTMGIGHFFSRVGLPGKIWSICFLLIIVGCVGLATDKKASLLQTTFTPTSKTSPNATPAEGVTYSITPTARVFPGGNCDTQYTKGHIFFLRTNGSINRNRDSSYDLYVMDGNGCSPNLVLPVVSGSPAWSVDSKKLAIGCENNAFLCILDIKPTLESCDYPQNGVGKCRAYVIQKYPLPDMISGDKRMYNISWAPGGSQIAVEGGNDVAHQFYVYILTLSGQGNWKMLIQGPAPLKYRVVASLGSNGVFRAFLHELTNASGQHVWE